MHPATDAFADGNADTVTDAFRTSLAFTLGWEGGYSDHRADPGGCTNMGITLATLRAWRGSRSVCCDDVRKLSKAETAAIYAARYWLPVRGDDLPTGINLVVFDWAVNSGVRRASIALQKAVAAAQIDGWIGEKTLRATRNMTRAVGSECLVTLLCDERQRFYQRLSHFPTFGKGWLRRNKACRTTALRAARKHESV